MRLILQNDPETPSVFIARANRVASRVENTWGLAVEPRAFEYNGMTHRVTTITSAWRTPAYIHFYIRDEQNVFFQLTYDEIKDEWTIRVFGENCPIPNKVKAQ